VVFLSNMDASIQETHDLLIKCLKEGKFKEAELVSKAYKLFPERETDRVINPVHADIKAACIDLIKRSNRIDVIHRLATIAKLSKDEVREHVVRWINDRGLLISATEMKLGSRIGVIYFTLK
jgi:hypothetical protein